MTDRVYQLVLILLIPLSSLLGAWIYHRASMRQSPIPRLIWQQGATIVKEQPESTSKKPPLRLSV